MLCDVIISSAHTILLRSGVPNEMQETIAELWGEELSEKASVDGTGRTNHEEAVKIQVAK